MPRYRPETRARKGKNASLTCICAPVVAGFCLRTSTILDQGPIDTCNLEVQTSKLQSIHCGLPASWTRARRHPPSSPSPVASRGGGRALGFLNWTGSIIRKRHRFIASPSATSGSTLTQSQIDSLTVIVLSGPSPKEFVNATRHVTFAETPPVVDLPIPESIGRDIGTLERVLHEVEDLLQAERRLRDEWIRSSSSWRRSRTSRRDRSRRALTPQTYWKARWTPSSRREH